MLPRPQTALPRPPSCLFPQSRPLTSYLCYQPQGLVGTIQALRIHELGTLRPHALQVLKSSALTSCHPAGTGGVCPEHAFLICSAFVHPRTSSLPPPGYKFHAADLASQNLCALPSVPLSLTLTESPLRIEEADLSKNSPMGP